MTLMPLILFLKKVGAKKASQKKRIRNYSANRNQELLHIQNRIQEQQYVSCQPYK
jgi:hypothetical protein